MCFVFWHFVFRFFLLTVFSFWFLRGLTKAFLSISASAHINYLQTNSPEAKAKHAKNSFFVFKNN